MELDMLFKEPNSGGGGCPSIYLAESGEFVIQGLTLDSATRNNLRNVLPGEGAVRISAEILLGAVAAYRSRQ